MHESCSLSRSQHLGNKINYLDILKSHQFQLSRTEGMPKFLHAAALLFVIFAANSAYAVPSFSRQTGLACNVCHTNPPELTAFGRNFKLNGYVLAKKRIGNNTTSSQDLLLSKTLLLSAMVLISDTAEQTRQPGSGSNTSGFPQQLSLFLAGEITPHVGGFMQLTYTSESDHFSMDNTDIRYANQASLAGKEWIYGITLNNNPTVEDLWNSTSAWGFPWISSNAGVSPIASPLLLGGLAQDVAGIGGYSMWDHHFYTNVTLYRSVHVGGPVPPTGMNSSINISGAAPYWRAAWQQTLGNNYLEVGTEGIYLKSHPDVITGREDSYMDSGLDFQYERPIGVNLLDVHGAFLHENSNLKATFALDGASRPGNHLNSLRLDSTFHWANRYSATGAVFSTIGNADRLLYSAAAVTGSRSGKPNTSGYIVQFSYWPAENLDISLAYTGYLTFNGGFGNYDGAGRNASDNNTVYLALWLLE